LDWPATVRTPAQIGLDMSIEAPLHLE